MSHTHKKRYAVTVIRANGERHIDQITGDNSADALHEWAIVEERHSANRPEIVVVFIDELPEGDK